MKTFKPLGLVAFAGVIALAMVGESNSNNGVPTVAATAAASATADTTASSPHRTLELQCDLGLVTSSDTMSAAEIADLNKTIVQDHFVSYYDLDLTAKTKVLYQSSKGQKAIAIDVKLTPGVTGPEGLVPNPKPVAMTFDGDKLTRVAWDDTYGENNDKHSHSQLDLTPSGWAYSSPGEKTTCHPVPDGTIAMRSQAKQYVDSGSWWTITYPANTVGPEGGQCVAATTDPASALQSHKAIGDWTELDKSKNYGGEVDVNYAADMNSEMYQMRYFRSLDGCRDGVRNNMDAAQNPNN
jgi:hypothetical protein